MMKAIMISIKPKWVAKILNGEKTIEIRKTMPKCDLPIDVYIYCTKDKNKLVIGDSPFREEKEYSVCKNNIALNGTELPVLNGHVVAKFTLNKVERFDFISERKYLNDIEKYNVEIRKHNIIYKKSCMSAVDVVCYLDTKCLGTDNPDGMIGYAWHIDNLVIFDRPKELGEFCNCDKYPYTRYISRPFQSWGYIEVLL